jgi:pyruvate/2-oxoglutarate dehydrogenase complex dihydrolipoamide acyltransferase (E2) component
MQVIRNLTGTLLIAGMASMAYAWSPRTATEPMNVDATASAAQQDQTTPPKPDDAKPKDTKPATKPAKPAKAGQPAAKPATADKTQHAARTQPAARTQQKQQPAQAQKGQASGAHGRIKDTDYQTHFGHAHSFSVRTVVTTTTIVPHQTQFAYAGYSFMFLAPWPSGWVLTDDCYIDYINGEYVLIDLSHPGLQIDLQIIE